MRNKFVSRLPYVVIFAIVLIPSILWADQADILYKEGLTLEKEGRGDFAVFRYFSIVRNHPASRWADEALFKIAKFYYDNKDYFNAKESFEKLLSKYPQSALAKEARAYLENISAMSHKSDIESSIRYILSTIENFKSEEKWDDVLSECEKLESFSPLPAEYNARLLEYYKMCGNAYLKKDELGKAKVAYEKIIKLTPDDTEVLNTLYEINQLLKPTPR